MNVKGRDLVVELLGIAFRMFLTETKVHWLHSQHLLNHKTKVSLSWIKSAVTFLGFLPAGKGTLTSFLVPVYDEPAEAK